MSRTNVGDVYAKVIKDVCEQSRVDFEEGGVELTTLDLLQSEWQKKLSGLKVAQLPWDPTPAPPPKEAPAPPKAPQQPLPSNGNIVNTPPAPPPQIPPMPQVKHESQPFPSQPAVPPQYSVPNFPQGQAMTARDRAANLLHQSYGDRAGPQIAQLQQSGQPRVPVPTQSPNQAGYIKQEDPKANMSNLQEFRPDLSQTTSSIKSAQTDGAGDDLEDWRAEYARRKALIMQERREMRLMREQFSSTQQQLEGGGLMIPLDERHITDRATRSKLDELQAASTVESNSIPATSMPSTIFRVQGDAAGDEDDDEEDEDAINSDLDDPDELAANDENGENTDQVMLCTYDKVQRVKNKWKCTLKDGILRVEGTEYVFHKGQGEFEW